MSLLGWKEHFRKGDHGLGHESQSAPSRPRNTSSRTFRAGARSNVDRSYEQIITDSSSSTTNIFLKVNLEKTSQDKKSLNISDSQLDDFIFKDLKLPIDDVLALGFSTGPCDSREVLVKHSTNLTDIITDHRILLYHTFRDHKITITTLDVKSTKVTFIDVPLNVPDEEIRHLCSVYGKLMHGTVHRVHVRLEGLTKVTFPGATR